jgi:hypothetical protein
MPNWVLILHIEWLNQIKTHQRYFPLEYVTKNIRSVDFVGYIVQKGNAPCYEHLAPEVRAPFA